MKAEELKKVIELHQKWLNDEPDGKKADLRWANLRKADLRWADLSEADLSEANLSEANLSEADLSEANLRWANLREADLRGADLSEADLRGADLSEAEGLLSTIEYLESHFEKTDQGYLAYKVFNGEYRPPEKWVIQPDSVITENVNFNRTNACGCGVNVAPLDWVKNHYSHRGDIWKVLIKWEWLVGVCVPYQTDGKIRCERVQLLEVVHEE